MNPESRVVPLLWTSLESGIRLWLLEASGGQDGETEVWEGKGAPHSGARLKPLKDKSPGFQVSLRCGGTHL